jgi:hypothetical protein
MCWTTERGGDSVVTVLKQLCFFLKKKLYKALNDDDNHAGK